jgi:hypothetical protein
MTMNTKKILLSVLLAGVFLPAVAEEANAASAPMAEARAFEATRFTGPLMRRNAKPVKNAPYSAEVVSERVQNLADGNQIVNKTSSMSYRDGSGRTRQEMLDNKGEVRVITLHDTDGNTFILHPQDKTATRIAHREIGRAAAEAARARIEQLRKEGKLNAERKGPDGENIIIKRVERQSGEQRKEIQENVRIRLAQALGDGKGPNGAELGPVIAGAFGDIKWASKASTRDLGTREFDGIKAEGKGRSYEIPAGEVGNRNPITVSHETWYSPELQVTVYSKHSDPRSGERIYRLANLKREEPAATLFAVPSDYTVKDTAAIRKSLAEKK